MPNALLPSELETHALLFLDMRSIASASGVNRAWCRATEEALSQMARFVHNRQEHRKVTGPYLVQKTSSLQRVQLSDFRLRGKSGPGRHSLMNPSLGLFNGHINQTAAAG